jgi:hypothetical protein
MNAAEQANSVERVSKIAAVVNLSPWLKNAETAKFDDPHSIDLAFHFPCRNFACQSQTILMQIRLPGTTDTDS